MVYGVQLFGCSKDFRKDTDKFFEEMKRIGLMQIEPCILFDEPNEFKEKALTEGNEFFASLPELLWLPSETKIFADKLREKGLEISSAHAFVSDIIKSKDLMVKAAKEAKIKAYVLNVAEYAFNDKNRFLSELKILADELDEIGTELWIHNLSPEISHKTEEGTDLYKWIVNGYEKIYAQPDTGWVLHGGEEPYEYLKSLGSKLKSIHFKDLNPDFKNKTGNDIFEVLGKGCIDVQKIMELYKDGITIVIDQDVSKGDFVSDLEESAKLLHSIK